MKITVDDISLIFSSLRFASAKHQDQRRKGGRASPYINHLIDVAEILWNSGGIHDVDTVVAGILHDIIEDTETSQEELETSFDHTICLIVQEVTDDKSLPKHTRKRLQVERAKGLSHQARQVKIADKISNILDIMESPPTDWSLNEQREYVDWAEEVINRVRGTNERLEGYFDKVCAEARRKFEDMK